MVLIYTQGIRTVFSVLLLGWILIGCRGVQPGNIAVDTANRPDNIVAMDSLTAVHTLHLMDGYFGLKEALTEDRADSAAFWSKIMLRVVDQIKGQESAEELQDLFTPLQVTLQRLAEVEDRSCEVQRLFFDTISGYIANIIELVPFPEGQVYQQYCPMAFNDRGAYWLSREENVKNPYFGKKMLECGEVVRRIQ